MKSPIQQSKSARHLVFYFQVHQPRRVKKFQFFDIGGQHSVGDYFDDKQNEEILHRIAMECYLPTNVMLLKLIKGNPTIKLAFSISGITLDEFEKYTPEVLESFKALAATGSVEFLAETNYHSLASMIPGDEFQLQVNEHAEKIKTHFDVMPSVFRNTELIYNDEIGRLAANMGFKGIICEGKEDLLGRRSPYQLYHHADQDGIKLLLRSNRLSDDIAFRFHNKNAKLTSKEYTSWLKNIPEEEKVIVLGMDYETFGEHHKGNSGIRNFLNDLLITISKDNSFILSTPSEVLNMLTPGDSYQTEKLTSWADIEKDTSAWLGNDMQRDAFDTIIKMEADVKKTHNQNLLNVWRNLLTSDHFYYMSTKSDNDGEVHSYFSHYPSPYEAFINYMNILSDFTLQVKQASMDESAVTEQQELERRTQLPPIWAEESAAAYKNGEVINR